MSKSKSSWKHKLGAVLVSCFTIVVVLLIGEGFCRLFMNITFLETTRYLFTPRRFGMGFGNTPNLEGIAFSEKFNIDGDGFRYDPDFRSAAPPDAPAILIIGDSVSFGPGVKDNETIAGHLRQAVPGKKFYNASTLGYDTFDYKNVISQIVTQKPDIKEVILFYCLNDLSDVSQQIIRQQTEPYEHPDLPRDKPTIVRHLNDYLRVRSKLYLWLRSLLNDSSRVYFTYDISCYEKPDEELRPALIPLKEIRDGLAEKGITFKVFLMPYEMQVRPNSPPEFFRAQEKVAKFLTENNIDHYYTLADFQRSGLGSRQFIFGDPMHLSAAGHRVAAGAVCREIPEKCTVE